MCRGRSLSNPLGRLRSRVLREGERVFCVDALDVGPGRPSAARARLRDLKFRDGRSVAFQVHSALQRYLDEAGLTQSWFRIIERSVALGMSIRTGYEFDVLEIGDDLFGGTFRPHFAKNAARELSVRGLEPFEVSAPDHRTPPRRIRDASNFREVA